MHEGGHGSQGSEITSGTYLKILLILWEFHTMNFDHTRVFLKLEQ